MIDIVASLKDFMVDLDWPYIILLTITGYGINHPKVSRKIATGTGIYCATRYRMVALGLSYAVAIYLLRDYEPRQAEVLLRSFVFALVFHKLILEKIQSLLKTDH